LQAPFDLKPETRLWPGTIYRVSNDFCLLPGQLLYGRLFMSESIWIVLIVAATVVVVLFMFRGALANFFLKASQDGFEAGLETHDPAPTDDSPAPGEGGVNITGNWQVGWKSKIGVNRKDVNVSDNLQLGPEQDITVHPDTDSEKKK
jgi:hypothetical protein